MKNRTFLFACVVLTFAQFTLAANALDDHQTTVDLALPRPNASLNSPMQFRATASSACSAGVASMEVYSGGTKVMPLTPGASIDAQLTLDPGRHLLTVRAFDNCGGSGQASVSVNVISRGVDIFSKQKGSNSGATATAAAATSSTSSSCGPPHYCSRTDTAVVAYPNPLPNFGGLTGVNTVLNDPDFHNPVLRFTDAHTDPTFYNRNFCTGLGGSGDKTVWNANSTLLLVCETGGRYFPVKFDPVNFRQLGPLYGTHPTFISGPGVFSHTNPNYFYKFTNGQVSLLDYTNRNTPPKPQLIYDFRNCGITSPVWQTVGGVDISDTVFSVAYSTTGGQNSGQYMLAYNKSTKQCFELNTATGVVTSHPGAKVIGTVTTTPDRFLIHNAVMKGSSWLVVVRAKLLAGHPNPTASAYAWQIGTPVLNLLVPKAGGHFATGCGLWINADGYIGEYFAGRHYSAPSSIVPVWGVNTNTCGTSGHPACQMPFDAHPATYGGCADNTPVCSSTVVKRLPNTITQPYQDEIVCFSTDGSNKQWRFAHTYSSVGSSDFNGAYSIGGLSQDGKFYAWTTVNGGAFGCSDGTMNCSVANRRTDVLVVKLQ